MLEYSVAIELGTDVIAGIRSLQRSISDDRQSRDKQGQDSERSEAWIILLHHALSAGYREL